MNVADSLISPFRLIRFGLVIAPRNCNITASSQLRPSSVLRGKISREVSCDALCMVLALVVYFPHLFALSSLQLYTHTEDITFIIIFINIIPNIIVSIIIESTLIA